MKRILVALVVLLSLSCGKNSDLVTDTVVVDQIIPKTVTLSVNIQKLYSNQNSFGLSGKGCVFPPILATPDLTKNYLVFESLDDPTKIQEITLEGLTGTFEITIYGNNYKLTASTHSTGVLPDYSDQFYWYGEQTIDLDVSSAVSLVMSNPYSAVVVINNEFDIAFAPVLDGTPLFANAVGWFIFTKVVGEESLVITKATLEVETILFSFEPTLITTYMYCDPLSLDLSKETNPFTLNTQIILH